MLRLGLITKYFYYYFVNFILNPINLHDINPINLRVVIIVTGSK